MSRGVVPERFGSEIAAIAQGFSQECRDECEVDIDEAGRIAVAEVKKTPSGAPVKFEWGSYQKGWRAKSRDETSGHYVTVYNSAKPGLTHLLEKGHMNRDGSRARAFPHVEPAYEKAYEYLMRRIGG